MNTINCYIIGTSYTFVLHGPKQLNKLKLKDVHVNYYAESPHLRPLTKERVIFQL